MVLPCAHQVCHWPERDEQRYAHLIVQSDEVRVLSQIYYDGCMMVRNRHMVDRSSLCICYLDKPKGGTMSTAAYACKKGLTIVNLALMKDDAAR